MMTKPKHPGRTPAERRILDAIGCGNNSPWMATSTRDNLLKAELIVRIEDKLFGRYPLAVKVAQYDMPIRVHMLWCQAMSAAEP
jgi:hypothetical protein